MSDRLYVPGGHGTQFSLRPPAGLNVPVGHGTHSVWPSEGWYHPAGHSTHAFCPTRNCTEPGGQDSHMHEFQRMIFPPVLFTALGSHTAHRAPGQQPVPRPPPARHPSALSNT